MTRLAIALLVCALAACPAKPVTAPASGGSGSGGAPAEPPPPAKKVILSWGISPVGELADVYLATTDETGKQVSHPIGRYKGACSPIVPAREMNALTGVACVTGGGGTELHAVRRVDEIIVVVLGTMPGVTADPMAREQIKSIKIPVGAAVEVAR